MGKKKEQTIIYEKKTQKIWGKNNNRISGLYSPLTVATRTMQNTGSELRGSGQVSGFTFYWISTAIIQHHKEWVIVVYHQNEQFCSNNMLHPTLWWRCRLCIKPTCLIWNCYHIFCCNMFVFACPIWLDVSLG
jgi:hypothetical protein